MARWRLACREFHRAQGLAIEGHATPDPNPLPSASSGPALTCLGGDPQLRRAAVTSMTSMRGFSGSGSTSKWPFGARDVHSAGRPAPRHPMGIASRTDQLRPPSGVRPFFGGHPKGSSRRGSRERPDASAGRSRPRAPSAASLLSDLFLALHPAVLVPPAVERRLADGQMLQRLSPVRPPASIVSALRSVLITCSGVCRVHVIESLRGPTGT